MIRRALSINHSSFALAYGVTRKLEGNLNEWSNGHKWSKSYRNSKASNDRGTGQEEKKLSRDQRIAPLRLRESSMRMGP